jgi:hypothetical protein
MTEVWDWLGLSGVAAAIGGFMGYGKLQQKITSLEQNAVSMADVKETLGRIDERTKAIERTIDRLEKEHG